MLISRLRKSINDTSISRKLYFTIGFTALLVIIELCTLSFSITTLSAVRSYVGGEGLWSKAQKDAIMNLREYAYSHKEEDYVAFQRFLEVPYGDKAARIELQKPNPDYELVRKYLLKGRNHPEDIDGMGKLLRRFQHISYLKRAFTAWARAEPALDELVGIGKNLHALVGRNAPKEEIAVLLNEIDQINIELTRLEDNFSLSLGEGARCLENVVLRTMLCLSLTIGITSVLIAISINRNLKKGVDAIISGSEKIRAGSLTSRVQVFSADEIGLVATAFNEMTETLEFNIKELKTTEDKMICEKRRAEKSERAKHQFLINMSHEMRTPLNAILGFARHIEKSVAKDDQESVRMIIASGDLLLITLNDILDFTKIDTGENRFVSNPFQVSNTIKSTVQLVNQNASLKKIDLKYFIDPEIPETIHGDGPRLSQILLGLVSNALKFTEHGKIDISATAFKKEEKEIIIEFRVKDTGIGIPKDKQEKIFDLFEQASNEMTRKFGGTGIGLSIVKHLVALQHGEISVSSIPGEGSEFCFRLPFFLKNIEDSGSQLSKPGLKASTLTSEYGKGIKVLIAEDNAINQLLVLKLLQKHSYQTTVAENGKVALEKYIENDFDIILMDLQMPEMDGYEATTNIRNLDSEKRNVPIVAMTAHTITGDYEKCMAIGINEYISKPFHPDELYEKIQLLVTHHS
jgi:signal transduction histidine kinase/ActR/RegA family two-component response regulator